MYSLIAWCHRAPLRVAGDGSRDGREAGLVDVRGGETVANEAAYQGVRCQGEGRLDARLAESLARGHQHDDAACQ